MTSLFQSPSDSPGFMLWKLTTQWQRQQRLALQPYQLTHVQFVFLACLQWLSTQTDAPITQSQLAKTSAIDKMVVSETALKLLTRKLITRESHLQDSRSYALALTAKGRKLVNKVLPIVEAIDQQFFSDNKSKVERFCLLVS